MIWLILGTVSLWLVVFHTLDRPAVPAWKARDAYRWCCLLLTVVLLLVGFKAVQYRSELRGMLATRSQ